jgi:hypothetical protein
MGRPTRKRRGFMLSEGEQAYRQALRYLRSVQGKEVAADEISSVVNRLMGALDPPHTETIARLVDLLNAHARSPKVDRGGASLTAAAILSASADVAGVIDYITVTKSEARGGGEDVGELVTRAARHGFLDLSASQVLAVVLVVLLSVGLPIVQVRLSSEVQSLMTDEEATLGLGLAVTLAVIQNRKK